MSGLSRTDRRSVKRITNFLLPLCGIALAVAVWWIASARVADLPSPIETWKESRIYLLEPFAKRGERDQGIGLARVEPVRFPTADGLTLGQIHYPFLPVRWLLRDRFASIDCVRQVRCPLLVIAGERDHIVPIEQSRRFYDAAASPKTLLVLSEVDHNDDELLAGEKMIRGIVRFLQQLG